jgi:hypothetical protein
MARRTERTPIEENASATELLPPHPLSRRWAAPPSEEQFQQIKTSIATEGLGDPEGWRFEGFTLDANTRGRACLELGILDQMHWNEFDPAVHGDPEVFVIKKNVHRRHFSAEQRTEIMVKLRERGETNQQIASTLGTSEPTVRRNLKRRRLRDAITESECHVTESESSHDDSEGDQEGSELSNRVINTRGQRRPKTYKTRSRARSTDGAAGDDDWEDENGEEPQPKENGRSRRGGKGTIDADLAHELEIMGVTEKEFPMYQTGLKEAHHLDEYLGKVLPSPRLKAVLRVDTDCTGMLRERAREFCKLVGLSLSVY